MSAALLRRAPGLAALACLAAGCIASYQTVPWIDTQRHPPPMGVQPNLPPGSADEFQPGPEVVLIVRHADPVQVRRAGQLQGYPLTFYDKRVRTSSGSWVHSGDGGRAEVLWPHGTALVLAGYGTGIVGSTSRGEPTFVFRELEAARFEPAREERVELLGGAILVAAAGPVAIERTRPDVVSVQNQSELALKVEFRDEVLTLEPGEVVDLALLSAGARPSPRARAAERLEGAGFSAEVAGDLEPVPRAGALELAAIGAGEVEALGLRIVLAAGDRVTLAGLGRPAPATAPPEAPAEEPAAPPVEEP